MKGFTVDLFRVQHALRTASVCDSCHLPRAVSPEDHARGAVRADTYCACPPKGGEVAGPAYAAPLPTCKRCSWVMHPVNRELNQYMCGGDHCPDFYKVVTVTERAV